MTTAVVIAVKGRNPSVAVLQHQSQGVSHNEGGSTHEVGHVDKETAEVHRTRNGPQGGGGPSRRRMTDARTTSVYHGLMNALPSSNRPMMPHSA